MITDAQFFAQMLIKIRAGDQVTSEEDHRLRVIAAGGAYAEPFPNSLQIGKIPDGMTAEEFASATRVKPALERGTQS